MANMLFPAPWHPDDFESKDQQLDYLYRHLIWNKKAVRNMIIIGAGCYTLGHFKFYPLIPIGQVSLIVGLYFFFWRVRRLKKEILDTKS